MPTTAAQIHKTAMPERVRRWQVSLELPETKEQKRATDAEQGGAE